MRSTYSPNLKRIGISFRQRNGGPIQLPVLGGELGHLNGLIDGHIVKDLSGAAGRPVDFQPRYALRLSQTERLLVGVGPEAAAGSNLAANGQRLVSLRDCQDTSADGRPVGLAADEFYGQPMIALAGVLKENIVILIAADSPSDLDENIDIAVAVPVAAGDA